MDSLREEIRQALESRGLIGAEAYGPVPVARTAELGDAWQAEVVESAAVQALIGVVLRLAEEIDALRSERGG